MLGIVPELRKFGVPQQGNGGGGMSSDEEGASANSPNDNKLGFMKRLKSFRKSTIRRAQGREKTTSTTGSSPQNHSILKDKLRAKYIQTTDVKKATLNPIWMEKFRLYVFNKISNFIFPSSLKVISKVEKLKHFIWIFGIMMMNFPSLKQQENSIKFKVLKDLIVILNK